MFAAVLLAVADTVHGSKQKRASLFCEDSNWVAGSVGKVYACYRNRDDDDHCKSYKTSTSSSSPYDRSRYDKFEDVTTYFIDCTNGTWDDVPGICRRSSGVWKVSAKCDTNDEEAIIPVITDMYKRRQRRKKKRRRASDRKQQRTLLRHGEGGETKEGVEVETGIVNVLEEDAEQDRNLKMEFDSMSRASRTSVLIDGQRWIILDYNGDDDDDSDECYGDDCDDDDDDEDDDDSDECHDEDSDECHDDEDNEDDEDDEDEDDEDDGKHTST